MSWVSCHLRGMSSGNSNRSIVFILSGLFVCLFWMALGVYDEARIEQSTEQITSTEAAETSGSVSEVENVPTVSQDGDPVESRIEDLKLFSVNGVVRSIESDLSRARIEHEEIPGYMKAMTMPFNIGDTNEWSNIHTNDSIMFLLHVTEERSWIDGVEKKSDDVPSLDELSETAPWRLVREVQPLKVGDMLPNYGLTNQFAKPITLDQFRGKALAMTFVYTRCPIPDFCPKMNRQFLEAQQKLQLMDNPPNNVHFLSISFDPVNDTPELLKLYASAYQHDPDTWTFATGKMIDIDALTEQFGLLFYRSEGTLLEWDHNLRTVLIDPEGKIQDIIVGNLWKTDELVEKILKLAQGKDLVDENGVPFE